MESTRPPTPPASPSRRGAPDDEEETRVSLERAEQAWRRQVAREEAAYAAPEFGPKTIARWLLMGLIAAGLLFLMVSRL